MYSEGLKNIIVTYTALRPLVYSIMLNLEHQFKKKLIKIPS